MFPFKKIVPDAALVDSRPEAEQKKDYKVDEVKIAGASPFRNSRPRKLGATEYSQEYTSSCVPHGFYTQLEYEGFVSPAPHGLSQLLSYRKRSNYPNPGSIAVDMYTQIRGGQSPNSQAPVTNGMREAEANALPYTKGSTLIKDFNYFQFTDLTQIPSAIAAGKAVAIFIYATNSEWSREYVTVRDPNLTIGNAYVRHCVCIMPNGDFEKNGEPWLAVHDSAAFGGRHLRYISLDFLLKRCYFAATVVAKEEVEQPPVIVDQAPTIACNLGDRGNAVSLLQGYLITNGYLEPQYNTGYYGALTAKAVLWFQLYNHKKFTADIPQLLEWGGEYWGTQSINAIKNVR